MADKEKEVEGRADGSMGIQVHHEERDALGFGQSVTGERERAGDEARTGGEAAKERKMVGGATG
ncbi:hypothetical protein COW64_07230 [bacterium (Candidatus Blackallbacteria) CG18_big_fil_WC_8_21_14_2_50_49_26]|nr:MAG: hypothetical protein COW64_07230 [bacterium (Candidatus Blackallbacteria) CG18_big_fil_WC_8_21_14_2_50_49_26]